MEKKEDFLEELSAIFDKREVSVEKVAKDIGTSKANIYNALRRGDVRLSLYISMINHPDVKKFYTPPPSLNFFDKDLQYNLKKPTEKVFPIVVDDNNREQINLVPIYAQAGYMTGYQDPEFIKTLPLSDGNRYEDGSYRDFEIKGDSMEDYFFERDVIRAKYLPEMYWDKTLTRGELFIILHKTDGIVFKQVIDHDINTGSIILHSFNNYYEDYTINIQDVSQIWYYSEYRSSRKFRHLR